jgi:hypothetical protein
MLNSEPIDVHSGFEWIHTRKYINMDITKEINLKP